MGTGMKTINTYINEKLRLTTKRTYTCQPKNKLSLQITILNRIKEDGPNCDLNDIDTSKITDMSYLFSAGGIKMFKKFNGDVSQWDVSNVKDMKRMFYGCEKFNCDLSKWNVSKVENMDWMFCDCEGFNCDISRWDVSNVDGIYFMFWKCKQFNQNLDSWNVSKVENMHHAFEHCPTCPIWYDRKQYDK
jgi:surface protein